MKEERDSTHPGLVDPFAHLVLSSGVRLPVPLVPEEISVAFRRLHVIGEKSRDQTEKLAVHAGPIRLERAGGGACCRLIG